MADPSTGGQSIIAWLASWPRTQEPMDEGAKKQELQDEDDEEQRQGPMDEGVRKQELEDKDEEEKQGPMDEGAKKQELEDEDEELEPEDAKFTGHPNCTMLEDCQGCPARQLVQHITRDGKRWDIYCTKCWSGFLEQEALGGASLRCDTVLKEDEGAEVIKEPKKTSRWESWGSRLEGHPACLLQQYRECTSSPQCQLVQHIHRGMRGSIYCFKCWAAAIESKPDMQCSTEVNDKDHVDWFEDLAQETEEKESEEGAGVEHEMSADLETEKGEMGADLEDNISGALEADEVAESRIPMTPPKTKEGFKFLRGAWRPNEMLQRAPVTPPLQQQKQQNEKAEVAFIPRPRARPVAGQKHSLMKLTAKWAPQKRVRAVVDNPQDCP